MLFNSIVPARCRIPECDGNNATHVYQTDWLRNALPYKHDRPMKCRRYASSNQTSSNLPQNYCPKSLFNETDVIDCHEFVFKSDEHRIIKEVGFSFSIILFNYEMRV